jgi:hypothetical protein
VTDAARVPGRGRFSYNRGLGSSRADPSVTRDSMAERTRTRRNTLERRCLPKTFKRMFVGAPKGIFKMLEKVKKA